MEIEIRGHRFIMLHQKAIYWVDRRTMLIADLHLGKITHFRKSGIAMPALAHTNNLVRLDELISHFTTDRIFLLGDLFHDAYNAEWDRFTDWRAQYASLSMSIMLGNHDRLPHHLFDEAEITITREFEEAGFLFTHHPVENPDHDLYTFAGHVHPVYALRSGSAPTLRLPCFVFDPGQAILPSFGVFTGGYPVEARPGRKLYVVGERSIFSL